MSLHIYRADHQPATAYRLPVDDSPLFRQPRRSMVWADCCERRRWAGYCTVQAYYDYLRAWCRPGRGCRRGAA